MAEDITSRRFVLSAYSFLIDKRGFPSPALGIGQFGDEHHQPTVVVIDPTMMRGSPYLEIYQTIGRSAGTQKS